MHSPQILWRRFRKTLLTAPQSARTTMFVQLADVREGLVSLRAQKGWREAWYAARPFVAFAVAYIVAWSYLFIAAFLGAQPPPAPLFPPGAVLLCALILAPPRRWWLYLFLAFLIQVPILAYLHLPLWWNLVGLIPDAIEPILAVLLLRRYLAMPPRFASLREVSIYTACITVAVAVAATIGSAVNAAAGQPYGSSWSTWFLGDTLSDVILAPTLLLWIAASVRGIRADSRWRYGEAILLYGGLLVLGGAVFDTRIWGVGIASASIYLPVPLLLWAAVRFGPRGITSALSLIAVLAVPAVANALGPFASVSVPAALVLEHIFQLQLFLLVIGVPLFFLAALVQERKHADQALQASEARYRAAFESAATGMMLVSTDGHPLHVNRPMVEILGYTEEELRSRTFADLTYPDDLEPNLTLLRQALAGKIDGYQLEKRFFDKRGHIVWGILSAGVVRDPAGKPLYLVGQLQDITERKRLEHEREEAHAQAERRAKELDRVFEAMADGVAVFDQNGRHLRSNAAYQYLLGLDRAPSNYEHLPVHERLARLAIRDDQGQPLAPEAGPLARALAGEVLAGEKALDLRVHTLDGREVDLRVSAAPIRTSSGQLVGAVSIYRDITEQKRLERALAEQAEQLDRIVESMGEGLIVYDMRGNVIRANALARQILGLGAAPPDFFQLSAEERLAVYAPRDQEGHLLSPLGWLSPPGEHDEDGLRENQARDVRMRTLDERELEVSATIAPLRTPDGQMMGAVLLLSDRTERNQLAREREEARASELALREVNQRLDTFVTMAAHDLRSPVAVSHMVVQRAQDVLRKAAADTQSGSDNQLRAFVQAAQALATTEGSLDRLWRLVQQLLDVSRVREGTFVLNRQPTDLVELVRACVAEQRLLDPSRVIDLDLPGPSDTGAIVGIRPIVADVDADRLGQVMSNYLSNAVRYSPEDQPINVTLRIAEEEMPGAPDVGAAERQRQQVAHIEVRDRGVGIAEEDQATIWNRFQRATSVREASGLGLGLYIVRTIVELHGGHVAVESRPGEGSTFRFTVPLLAAAASAETAHGIPDDVAP